MAEIRAVNIILSSFTVEIVLRGLNTLRDRSEFKLKLLLEENIIGR